MADIYPFARPLYVMAKAAGPQCNLRCRYCYYTEKQNLFAGGSCGMSREMLELSLCAHASTAFVPAH